MNPLFSTLILAALLVTSSLSAPASPTYRLKSTTRDQYLRVTTDGTVRVDGHKTTELARQETCFHVFRQKNQDVVLQNTIGEMSYVVVVDSNGEVSALPGNDVEESESGSGVVYRKVFRWQGCGRRQFCLSAQVQGKSECYLHFDTAGLAQNACSDEASQNKESFRLETC